MRVVRPHVLNTELRKKAVNATAKSLFSENEISGGCSLAPRELKNILRPD